MAICGIIDYRRPSYKGRSFPHVAIMASGIALVLVGIAWPPTVAGKWKEEHASVLELEQQTRAQLIRYHREDEEDADHDFLQV